MKYLLMCESGDMSKVPALFPAHRQHWASYAQQKTLLMVGPVKGGPPQVAALSVFSTREAAEEFARADPFVTGGAVKQWTIAE